MAFDQLSTEKARAITLVIIKMCTLSALIIIISESAYNPRLIYISDITQFPTHIVWIGYLRNEYENDVLVSYNYKSNTNPDTIFSREMSLERTYCIGIASIRPTS